MSRRATALEFGLAETSSCRGRLLRHFVRPRAGRGDVDALELYDAMEKTRLTLEYGARAARSPELKADLRRALDQLEADKTWLRDFGLRHSLPGFGERFLRSS